MRQFILGAAAIALSASLAQAEPGKDRGNGSGKDNAPAKVERGGGGADFGSGKAMKEPGGGQARKADREPATAQANSRSNGNADRAQKVAGERDEARGDRASQARDQREKGNGNGGSRRNEVAKASRDNANDDVRTASASRDHDVRWNRDADGGGKRYSNRNLGDWRVSWYGDSRNGLVEGCPPGLAKKINGCMPPGRARQDDGWFQQNAYRPDYFGLSGLTSGRYIYDDGYLMRYDGDRVSGYIPLLGGALSIGNAWPDYYRPVTVPDYYQDYYNLGPSGSYRYADDVLYRVDPESTAITSIAALLTGDEFAVGQPMPEGYDIYNVPAAHRDNYYDTPDANYRYADGYVYQVDPTTKLITAAIELLS